MKVPRHQRIAVTSVAVTAAVCGVVYFFPPSSHSFYPKCPFHALTGWQCPGCGATRALHEILHGNLTAAWAYNQLFVAALPFLVLFFAVQLVHLYRRGTWYVIPGRSVLIYGTLALAVCFGVVRNLISIPGFL